MKEFAELLERLIDEAAHMGAGLGDSDDVTEIRDEILALVAKMAIPADDMTAGN